jgi:hypothetical protein
MQQRGVKSISADAHRMASPTTLPPELIFDIADHLETSTDINALSQTSSQLHAVANPYLYQ